MCIGKKYNVFPSIEGQQHPGDDRKRCIELRLGAERDSYSVDTYQAVHSATERRRQQKSQTAKTKDAPRREDRNIKGLKEQQ